MKAFRNRLRQAVLAAIPAVAVACTNGRAGSSGATGGGTSATGSSGSGSGSSGTTGSLTTQNLCDQCAAEGMTCNTTATQCVSYCELCMCAPVSAPVGRTDGGYPDGGLPLALCKAACPDPAYLGVDGGPPVLDKNWDVIACALGDGGCPSLLDGGSAGDSCVICNVEDCSGIGRAPEGLCPRPLRAEGLVGEAFARAAYLEAASVAAFDRLALELAGWGAPEQLVARARQAAREEARHAELMGEQARRFGGEVSAVQVRATSPRGLEDFALENAREGCVRETFGAAVCRWQAIHAADPGIRRALEQLADDEAGHAELSWSVGRWAMGRLSLEAQQRVREAMRAARLELSWGPPPVPELERAAGQPNPAARAELLAQLDALIWSEPV